MCYMSPKVTFQDQVHVEHLWQGTCNCGQVVIIAEDLQGDPVILHDSPRCSEYKDLSLFDYIQGLKTDV